MEKTLMDKPFEKLKRDRGALLLSGKLDLYGLVEKMARDFVLAVLGLVGPRYSGYEVSLRIRRVQVEDSLLRKVSVSEEALIHGLASWTTGSWPDPVLLSGLVASRSMDPSVAGWTFTRTQEGGKTESKTLTNPIRQYMQLAFAFAHCRDALDCESFRKDRERDRILSKRARADLLNHAYALLPEGPAEPYRHAIVSVKGRQWLLDQKNPRDLYEELTSSTDKDSNRALLLALFEALTDRGRALSQRA